MPQDHEFCEPLRVFAPNKRAESFILCSLRVSRTAMQEWLDTKDGEFARFDIRVKDPERSFPWPEWGSATPFATVNSWQPKPREDVDEPAF